MFNDFKSDNNYLKIINKVVGCNKKLRLFLHYNRVTIIFFTLNFRLSKIKLKILTNLKIL